MSKIRIILAVVFLLLAAWYTWDFINSREWSALILVSLNLLLGLYHGMIYLDKLPKRWH
ncbi:MAG: hypothetical protein JJT77_08490 [Crocinitomicaceae bacterium]|nr:hypothetical protein [Crocinitomicaceae bacterium]